MSRVEIVPILKAAVANGASWCGTIMTLQQAHLFIACAAGCGSVAVSVATVWWIRKQARAMDAAMLAAKKGDSK